MMNSFFEYIDIFFWDDIRKENTNFNFLILTQLCKVRKSDIKNEYLLNKPMLIILVSIIECILYDLIKRISEYTYKDNPLPAVDFIAVVVHDDIKRAKTVFDKFKQIVLYFENLPSLLEVDNQVYIELHELRELRNRIHIQIYDKENQNENNIWTEEKIQLAGKILENLCAILSSKFPRADKEMILNFSNFPRPWLSD